MTIRLKNTVYALCAITDRGRAKMLKKLLREEGIELHLRILAEGTAQTRLLDYLGLGDSERDVLMCAVTRRTKGDIVRLLKKELALKNPGCGIVFTIPMKGIAGPKTLSLFMGDDAQESYEEDTPMEKPNAELIITIVNRGYSQEVVVAAKEAGAQGGTVVHGRGTGDGAAMRFFNITVEPEKDVVLLLVKKEVRTEVMRAICRAAGLKTQGKGITFSLPVEDVVGVYGIDDTVS